jgi:predicted neuraminidase
MSLLHSLRNLLALTTITVAAAVPTFAADPVQEFIYTTAPFPSAHASTLVETSNGDVLAAWFGGAREGANDVAIWASRRTAVGTWSSPVELVREPGVPCWNPVLFKTRDGHLWLYYKFGPNVRSWTGARIVSTDEGKTWSKPEHLPAGLLGPIKDKPLVLPNGNIVSGTSVESYTSWATWIDRSSDNGKTWWKSGPITVPAQFVNSSTPDAGATPAEHVSGIIQPAVVNLGHGHLRLYARSTRDIGRICVSDSRDNGVTWTEAHPIDLPNPNSGIDAVGLSDGRVALIFNNTTKGRSPLNVAISSDGEHFTIVSTLEDQPGEFSYPAIIQGKSGKLLMTYTWNRQRIRYAELTAPAHGK